MANASTIVCIGIVVGVVSSATQSLGLTLQRKASVTHVALVANEERPGRSLYRNTTWQLGLGLFLLANIVGSTVQIATLPLIVLAPLQSCGLLFNSLAARYVLKEHSSWRTPLATLLIVAGGMVIGVVGVSSSSSHSITHSLAELWKLAQASLFRRWFVSTNALVGVVLALTWYNSQALPTFVKGISYGCCSGIWSAHSLLMAKSVSDVVTHAVMHGSADLFNSSFWILVAVFVSLSLTQLFLLNTGLRHLSTSILYPLVFCIYNLVNIFNGIVFFNDQEQSLSKILGVVLTGVVSLICGVVLLSRDQFIISQGESFKNLQDSQHRTSMLSYTSLRPKSVDLAALQAPTSSNTETSDPFYVSLPQTPKRDKYNSMSSSKRNSRRVLSFEQEGILSQMV